MDFALPTSPAKEPGNAGREADAAIGTHRAAHILWATDLGAPPGLSKVDSFSPGSDTCRAFEYDEHDADPAASLCRGRRPQGQRGLPRIHMATGDTRFSRPLTRTREAVDADADVEPASAPSDSDISLATTTTSTDRSTPRPAS